MDNLNNGGNQNGFYSKHIFVSFLYKNAIFYPEDFQLIDHDDENILLEENININGYFFIFELIVNNINRHTVVGRVLAHL